MQSIDVVAITELLGVAAPLMERKLGLVPNSLVIPHGNANEEKPDVSQKTRDALAQLPAVQHEKELYGEALSRFRSELRAEGLPVYPQCRRAQKSPKDYSNTLIVILRWARDRFSTCLTHKSPP